MGLSRIQIPPADEQLSVLTRGIADLHPLEELKERLHKSHCTQEPLLIKAGFDPTAPDLHLGHTVLTEKMAQFQRLGHDVVFLVGDYTARIGDPTGRNAARPPLTEEQISANASTYTAQCWKVLDRERTRIDWNSRWLAKLEFSDVIVLASRYNLGRMLERRDFRQRFDKNQQIALHELLYPLVQAYDSVALKCDVELGGHDQIFNLNVGRHVMEAYGLRPQIVMTVGLLVGLDGIEKMSKSKGNHIPITDSPDEMFGKIMSISDETMLAWIPLLTPDHSVAHAREHPLEAKKLLARAIVTRFCSATAADDTAAWWDAGRPPRKLAAARVAVGPLYKVVQAAGAAKSLGEARRKIEQGGVSLDGERCADPLAEVRVGRYLLQVGKKWAIEIEVT